MPLKPEPCPGGCDHTGAEHYAFDLGWNDGRKRRDKEACPYTQPDLVDAWEYGLEFGLGDFEE